MRRLLYTLFSFVICCNAAMAAQRDINVKYLSVEDGLSHYTVNSIYQDEMDFIWIGTQDGLNRYDGHKFEIFTPGKKNSIGLQENNIRKICGNHNGKIYIRGMESISMYDMRSATFTVMVEGSNRDIYHDGQDFWYASTHAVHKWNEDTQEFVKVFDFENFDVMSITIDVFLVAKNGDLCIQTSDRGFYRVNSKGHIIQHFKAGASNSIFEDSKENVWIGTRNNGLFKCTAFGEVKHYTHEKGNPNSIGDNNIRQIVEDKDGKFWMATFNGLCRLDAETEKFSMYNYENDNKQLNLNSIISILCDRQGALWLGSFYEGLIYYNPLENNYRHYKAQTSGENALLSPIVGNIIEDKDQNLWMGTEGGGVSCLNPQTGHIDTFTEKDGLSSNIVKSILYDEKEDKLYVATLKAGLNSIDIKTRKIKNLGRYISNEKNLFIENVVEMKAGDENSIYLATNIGITIYNKKDGSMRRLRTAFYRNYRAQAWAIEEDGEGNLWFTTSTNLYRYNLASKSTSYYTFQDICDNKSNNHLNHILKDSKGRLWFGSSGAGIFRYNKEEDNFTQVALGGNLSNSYVTGLVEDKTTGNIYISTNNGIAKLCPETLDLTVYNKANGNPFGRINENSIFITHDRNLIVCNMHGITSVPLSKIGESHTPYKVYISQLLVNNKRIKPSKTGKKSILQEEILFQDSIRLRPEHRSVSFVLSNTNYVNSSNGLMMEYKLEGSDKDFIRTTGIGPITYMNLSPGKYHFIARGRNADNYGEYPSTSLDIEVIPPFYKTGWFVLICMLISLGVTMWLVRSYTTGIKLRAMLDSEKKEKQYIQQANQEKLRLFTNISHEFRTPLTLIDGQLELLLKRSDIKPSIYTKILNIYKNSRKLRLLVDEIVDIRKQEAGKIKLKVVDDDICSFLKEIYISFEEHAKMKKIHFNLKLPDHPIIMKYDTFQMEKVFMNLLSNAFKFTAENGTITVEAKEEENNIIISVSDNGAGIAEDKIAHVFDRFFQDDALNAKLSIQGSGVGLSLTKSLVEMHDGTISVSSEQGVSTCFTVNLPKEPHFKEGTVELASELDPTSKHWNEYSKDIAAEVVENITNNETPSLKMLIVEDNDEVRSMLEQIFSGIYKIETASNGEEGIEKTMATTPDIILSDVMMPGISGFEMCRRLKNNFETCHIPIVLLTAKTAESQIIEGLQTGADDYVTKPFSIDILISRCNNLIRGRQRLQQKYMKQPETSVDILTNDPREQKMLEEAVDIVMKHLDDATFNIEVFAKEMGLSRTYLFTKIKGLTGQSPNDFISTIRLKQAAVKILEEPDMNMADIAYSLGFSSSSYFIKCFKNIYGETPSAFRKRNTSKTAKTGQN